MKVALYMIEGGDFKQAGQATENLKKLLKQINIHPADLRRTIIAAFEAEMNVVIHAQKGNMRVIVDSNEIEVEVRDRGPGIADIELAMTEGYSTASLAARQMGYGAGMGLPNMKKNSDLFEISSPPGEGARVTFMVRFRPLESSGYGVNSISVVPAQCKQCMVCLRVCPTQALRVRESGPELIKDLCIDCGACLEFCKTGALAAAATLETVTPSRQKLLILPPAFLSQFSAKVRPLRVLATLERLGFSRVQLTQVWEDALREAVIKRAESARVRPVISPVCPAVLNLIMLRFHSLFENVAPFFSPLEAAKQELIGTPAVFTASCPAQITALLTKPSEGHEVIIPRTLRQLVQPLIIEGEFGDRIEETALSPLPEINHDLGILEASGLRHVSRLLSRVENGRLRDVRILELWSCEGGCFGSPLFSEESLIARYRWSRVRGGQELSAFAVAREHPLVARTGLRLDRDVSRAIDKVAKIEEVEETLPGKDCAMCGAPTCAALAEDIVLGRAGRELCPYLLAGRGVKL